VPVQQSDWCPTMSKGWRYHLPESSSSCPRSFRTVRYCRWLVMSVFWYGTPM
jgi:hypothetical protein